MPKIARTLVLPYGGGETNGPQPGRRRRIVRIAVLGAALLLAALVAAAVWVYFAVRHVPAFYARAIDVARPVLRKASDEMLQNASAMASDLQKGGRWQAVFTEAQINGWLAVDLVENHPSALPPESHDPRVHIEGNNIVVAFQTVKAGWSSVVSLTLEPYLVRSDLLAVRVRRARAGQLPLPLNSILDAISEGVRRANFRIEWRQTNGDPVAQISLPTPRDSSKAIHVDAFHVSPGKIAIGGTTGRR